MKSQKILLLVCCFFCFGYIYGQSNQYIFSHIDINQGLTDNHVTCFFKDRKGFIWIGTAAGLNRYDGYKLKVFKYDPADTLSVSDDYIVQIFEGPEGKLWIESREGRFDIYNIDKGRFEHQGYTFLNKHGLPGNYLNGLIRYNQDYWFVYQDSGVYHYTAHKNIIPIKCRLGDESRPDPTSITSSAKDEAGDIWLVHQNGMLEKIDGRLNKVTFRMNIYQKLGEKGEDRLALFIDKQNDLWIRSDDLLKGVLYFHPPTGEIRHLTQNEGPGGLNSNVIYDVCQDKQGLIWLCTDRGGINLVDKRDFSVKFLQHIDDDPKSLTENDISNLYTDSTGIVWAGTMKNGVNYYNPSTIKFPLYRHQPFDPTSLKYNDINAFVEDPVGNIWIGANGGGLICLNRKTNTFRQYLHNPSDPHSLSNDIIVSMMMDRHGKLWLGTYFGGLECFDGHSFTHFKHDAKDSTSLADDRVMCMFEDADDVLWVGTLGQGMDRLDKDRKHFQHYNIARPGTLQNNYVSSIIEDARHNIWVGTGFGIDVLKRSTGTFIHYSREVNKLSANNTIELLKDDANRIWVGTREGLDVFNPTTQTFKSFRTKDGLPDNNIRSLKEDKDHHIWASTSNGIVRVSLVEGEGGIQGINCRSYGEQDGLQGAEFNEKASLVTRDGHLLFGGPNGINFFHPDSIADTKNFPPIVFTDLELYNKSVNVGDKTGGHPILQKSIIDAPEATLNYNDNVFSIEFASLSFVTNSKAKYAYWLEGFNTSWMQADGNMRKATYTNLPPGHYTLRVRATNEDGVWNDKEARLSIIILPPWWKTPLAYIVYAILFVVAVYFSRRMVIERARMRFAVEHERQEAKRIQEVDKMKIRFFTNMSHELRTPLSLILAPVERLLENPQLPEPRKQYELIRRNAKRLLFLVGQLLDFRKMEANELRLHATRGDLLTFIREISYSFTDLAENKGITFSYHAPAGSLYASFDHDKMERILFNLLSNAFKFTAEKGVIGVEVLVRKQTEAAVWLDIKVKDTGIGIPADQQEKIFEPFFQSDTPAHILNQGTGLGLAITMEYVRMHGGTLRVESESGNGSCFVVSLPLADAVEGAELPAPMGSGAALPDVGTERSIPGSDSMLKDTGYTVQGVEEGKRPTVLIVEDNEDFRFYLKDNLRAYFQILEASNGKEGWQKTLSQHPDLIVSDISMPIMNGIDFCKKVKHDERTVQIPLILLTAMASETHELVSLQTGATDYIPKPFNFEVLLSKIRNHIHFHETAKRTYQRQVQVSPSAVAVASADEQFLKNLLVLIEKNMDNPEFSVTQLSKEFNSSRSTIYKRLLALTGKHPIEFIRHVRLKRAAELLEKTQMSVAEVAYSVGFNDPKYFTQFFKSEFGMVPSAYRTFKKQEPK